MVESFLCPIRFPPTLKHFAPPSCDWVLWNGRFETPTSVAVNFNPSISREITWERRFRSLQHTQYAPRILVNDWHEPIVVVSDAQIDAFHAGLRTSFARART